MRKFNHQLDKVSVEGVPTKLIRKNLQGSEKVESLHRCPQKFPSMALANRHEAPTVDRAFRAEKWGGPRFSVEVEAARDF